MISQEYFSKVKKFLNGDEKKTWDWFKTNHPAFGMFSPINMIKLGREKKVIAFIDSQLER